MWFISRCISIDSLNSCFQQQKNKTSYDFCSRKEGSDSLVKRKDEDDCEPLPKKSVRNHHHQHIRRRIPKRYSDIIAPSSTKLFTQRKDATIREKQTLIPASQSNHRHSLKPINETIYCFNSHRKKSREKKDPQNNHIIKHNDILAHRMQAAMSSELMHSLDRNFVFGDRKQLNNNSLMPRSHSFNICTSWNKTSKLSSSHQLIPRVKIDFDKENISCDEPTPDYNQEFIIRTIRNEKNILEEPIADYDDSKTIIKNQSDERSTTQSDFGVSSSFIVLQTSTMSSNEQTSTPPVPPPLPNLNIEQKKITFRCRTIAEKLSSEHKLILKDEKEINHSNESKPHYFQISKDLIFQKISQSLTHSSIASHDHETDLTTICAKPSITDEQIQDGLSSSSPATSIINDNEYEPNHSSSSKIYNDYKKRASLPSTILSHSIIIHPMHTRIGLRSSTSSSSTNEKLTDMTLSSKQMNVCVINQLNEHLSTRFRKQQQQQQSSSNNNHIEQQSYDQPPKYMTEINIQSNVYDEPNDGVVTKPICSSSIPPPPPPLPVGGFRPINPPIYRSSNSQRTSIMTLPREANNLDIPYSTGTSTISSNLSDTRILHELRENPLFTRAKQHLEVEPGSNGRRAGRRLIGSTSNLAHTETISNETVSYLRLENCSKTNLRKSIQSTTSKQLETIIMLPNELDAILGKRTKSTNDINQIKSRPCTKSLIQTQCRQSELELIFKKRAQRSEHNLT